MASRGHSSSRCAGLSLSWPLPLRSTGSRRAQAQQLWLTGRVAPRHVGSSQTRARTRVPCIGRQTPNHCATREAPDYYYLGFKGYVCVYAHIWVSTHDASMQTPSPSPPANTKFFQGVITTNRFPLHWRLADDDYHLSV